MAYPGEHWIVLTTTAAVGRSVDTVIAGVQSGGAKAASHAVSVSGDERVRVVADYKLPWAIWWLSGFPPRSFLRLDPHQRRF